MQRKTFIQQTGIATAGIMFTGLKTQPALKKKRLAVMGTGGRALDMWTKPVLEEFGDIVEFVGLCDINKGRVETVKKYLGLSCPTFTDFNEMMQTVKPDDLIVTTVDGTHHEL